MGGQFIRTGLHHLTNGAHEGYMEGSHSSSISFRSYPAFRWNRAVKIVRCVKSTDHFQDFQLISLHASVSTVLQGNQDAIPPPSQGQNDATGQTGLDGPWFQALVDMDKAGGSVLAIVSGHNHGDSYCASGASSSQIPLWSAFVPCQLQFSSSRVLFDHALNLHSASTVIPEWGESRLRAQ